MMSADLDAARVGELGERDHALALEPDVDQHFLVVDRRAPVPRTISPSPMERSDSSYCPNISARSFGS